MITADAHTRRSTVGFTPPPHSVATPPPPRFSPSLIYVRGEQYQPTGNHLHHTFAPFPGPPESPRMAPNRRDTAEHQHVPTLLEPLRAAPSRWFLRVLDRLAKSLMLRANRASSTLACPSTTTLQSLTLDSPDSQLDAMPVLDASLAAAHVAHFYQHSTLLNAATFKRTLTISSLTIDYGNVPRTRSDSPRRTSSRPSSRLPTAAPLGQRTRPNGSLGHSQLPPIYLTQRGQFTSSLNHYQKLTYAIANMANVVQIIAKIGISADDNTNAYLWSVEHTIGIQCLLPQSSPHRLHRALYHYK